MKILMVLPFLKAGGTERQASYITNYLHRKGHQVDTLCIEKTGPFGSLFNTPVHFLNSKNSNSRLFLNVLLCIRFLSGKDVDVIVSRAWSANIITGLVSILTGKPAVLFLSGALELSSHSWFKKRVFHYVLIRSAKIISVSRASKENCMKWLGIPGDKIEVVYNGVDVEWVNHEAQKKFELPEGLIQSYDSVIFTGSLNHRKGVDVLLKAVSKIIPMKKVNVIVVGDSEMSSYYKNLSNKLKIDQFVYFVGEKLNPFPYMKYGCIFVLPSRAEGFPNVLLEAMALKNTVVAADCETGPGEILDGKNGTLISVDNSAELAETILIYLNNPELRRSHGEGALHTIENSFQLNRQMEKVETVLQNVIDN
jgi:glycosyltransferase involved in cell wall biosynthesis